MDSFQRIVLEPIDNFGIKVSLGSSCGVWNSYPLGDPEALLLEIDAGIAALAGYEITSDDIEIREGGEGRFRRSDSVP